MIDCLPMNKSYNAKNLQDEEEHRQELAVFEEVVAPAMAEAQVILKQSGDSVSDVGLEMLAKWKLGITK